MIPAKEPYKRALQKPYDTRKRLLTCSRARGKDAGDASFMEDLQSDDADPQEEPRYAYERERARVSERYTGVIYESE